MTIMSGFMKVEGRRIWLGCGSEEELYALAEQLREDLANDGKSGAPSIEVRPATPEEIEMFNKEIS